MMNVPLKVGSLLERAESLKTNRFLKGTSIKTWIIL